MGNSASVASNAKTTRLGGVTGKGFMPGRSGNPSGARKTKPLTDALLKLLPKPIPGDAKGRTFAQAAAEGLLAGAVIGEASNFREAADRVEGKVPTPLVGAEGEPLFPRSELLEEALRLADHIRTRQKRSK